MRTLVCVSSHATEHATRVVGRVIVTGLDDVRRVLEAHVGDRATTLDLVGHTTRGHHYLRLGRDVLDLLDPAIARAVTSLRTTGALDRAAIVQLRLLGCETAIGPGARTSLRRLAVITGRPVVGTTRPLLDLHHGPDGLRPEFAQLLMTFSPTPIGWPSWNRRARTAVSGRSA